MSHKAVKRILNDIKQYKNSDLKENGIYIIFNEDNIFNIKAMIVGPSDTPYSYGYYFFDINFPNNYPIKNPKVDFCTLDERVRFNPNLYKGGKVCLSILGTWSGPGWTSVMTLNTVLLSLQTLLCENPVNNEPGLENIMRDDARAVSYNNLITYYNFEVAMLKIFMKMPVSFEDFRDDCVKEFFKNYDAIKDKLHALLSSEYNNKEYTSKFFGMHCRMEYGQLISYFENEYKYLLNDYERIIEEEERNKNLSTDDSGAGAASGTTECPEEELPMKTGKIDSAVLNSNRKCPYDAASYYHVDDKEEGLDGKMWVVKQRTNGVKYWKRMVLNTGKE